ncbi:Rpn family recombination-promoting nuclease/putative transposase [Nostoc sp. CHAB 5836]|uniref:Rpn family recombination-promoting nuclease/putative transposase n=1 Tax=Nostoc sp. CHAB 5836 TaxID=2780404 RepID=UPI001E2E9F55|nr:Rpn family recombination-promoting nuclease/putative transposase [Nostoc sp. CHAB 5836]MCC5617818.1 Rpn family recombination-promoting nuclease/putative transposase [Nostoc sp. CHAB 5836]
MFDNLCKFLVENFSSDFATWLLGEPIALTELSPKELSIEPIRADALILRQSEEIVLHIEFQTQPDKNIPFRMTDYRLRVYRRFPGKRMHQVVVYLQKTDSELVQQTTFTLEETFHRFQVIRLWEQPTEIFLQTPGLLPFAVLSNTSNKTNTLQKVAAQIDNISDQRTQSNLAASTFILAGLVLEKEEIQRLLRRDIMRESVTYQSIKDEGSQETTQKIAVKMLQEGLSPEMVAKVTGLTLDVVQQLQITEAENQRD